MAGVNGRGFGDRFAARVAELYSPMGAGDGFDEAELADAEARLGFRLPGVLREVYAKVGRRTDLTCRDRLVPPGELRVRGGAIVFFEGLQDGLVWGVPVEEVGRDDPPVWLALPGEPGAEPDWDPDCDHLSDFLVIQLYREAASGGLPFSGWAAADETILPEVRQHWPLVERKGMGWDHLLVFARAGQVVCVGGEAPNLTVQAAGRTRDDLDAIARRLGLTWEDESADDEG